MWRLAHIDCNYQVWFSDGKPIGDPRGGHGESLRLIVDGQGFLDITEIYVSSKSQAIDANGLTLCPPKPERCCNVFRSSNPHTALSLEIRKDRQFTLTWIHNESSSTDVLTSLLDRLFPSTMPSVSGRLKPLPEICADDAYFIDSMIDQKYVPCRYDPDAPGKTTDEIKALGQQLFPFTPYSFQLAMCIYDWTTISFVRLVYLKIFQYTGYPPPFPLDQKSIAAKIWASNWDSFRPQNPGWMRCFMMKPANSLEEVETQLGRVAERLHLFSDVENRLLCAAIQSLPRTTVYQRPRLYSGQVDISELGMEHFGIEMLECPGNNGPVDEQLEIPLPDALETYLAVGKTFTTKMVWSFTDSVEDAAHYANGILLIMYIPEESMVWERVAFITPLSDDPEKREYIFMPESRFEVLAVESGEHFGDDITYVITLRPRLDDELDLH